MLIRVDMNFIRAIKHVNHPPGEKTMVLDRISGKY